MRTSRPALVALPVALLAAALLLAGCTPADPEPSPSPTPSDSATPSESPTPSATPTDDPTAGPPVDAACDALVSPDTVYAFNPSYLLLDSATPPAGSAAAADVAVGGRFCRWVQESSGFTIDLSVGGYSADALAQQRDAASSGTPTSRPGVDAAWFAVDAQAVGTLTAFAGDYRVTIVSFEFDDPAIASPFLDSTVAALR